MTNKVFTAFYVYFGVMVLGVSGKIRNSVNWIIAGSEINRFMWSLYDTALLRCGAEASD